MYRLANNYDYKEESISEVTENRECSIDARAPADERTNPQKKVKKNTKKQTRSTRPDQTGNRELADERTNAPKKVQKNTKSKLFPSYRQLLLQIMPQEKFL